MKVAIVSDFIFEGGSEAVVNIYLEMYPEADMYTAIYDPTEIHKYPSIQKAQQDGRLFASSAQLLFKFRWILKYISVYHWYWLYFITTLFQQVRGYDLVIVSSCAQSKLMNIAPGPNVIVYVHTPTRWLYKGLVTEYDTASIPSLLKPIFGIINTLLQPLDQYGVRKLAKHSPLWLSNSTYTRDNVKQWYNQDSKVIFPPVNTTAFQDIQRNPQDFYLYHGRLTMQKRVDVAIKACLLNRQPLQISGKSVTPEIQHQLDEIVRKAVAEDPTLDGLITFLGRTSDEQLKELFATCKALVFPPREDFGIAPIEAIASGVPVIAYQSGGALDYIKPGINGEFFETQDEHSLAEVLKTFDASDYNSHTVKNSLPPLSIQDYKEAMNTAINTFCA